MGKNSNYFNLFDYGKITEDERKVLFYYNNKNKGNLQGKFMPLRINVKWEKGLGMVFP